jgi:hypothetical protein
MEKLNKASRNVGLYKTVLVERVKLGTLKHGSRISSHKPAKFR